MHLSGRAVKNRSKGRNKVCFFSLSNGYEKPKIESEIHQYPKPSQSRLRRNMISFTCKTVEITSLLRLPGQKSEELLS